MTHLALGGGGGAGLIVARRVPQSVAVGLGGVKVLKGVVGVAGGVARLVLQPVAVRFGGVQVLGGGLLVVAVGLLTCRH